MRKSVNTKKGLSTLEVLERELTLKQLQINRLLDITQAINNNVSADGLYKMYNSFLQWELGVKRMALYIADDRGHWQCATFIGLSEALLAEDVSERLHVYQRLNNLSKDEKSPLLSQFDVVIPVMHKQLPIAYAFIGGLDSDEDMYNLVQFITTITNIVAVAIENKRLFKRQLEQERLNREMELAREMQNMLVPANLPSNKGYQLASIYQPHFLVGGDYYDFIDYDDPRFAFCIADISGKGVAAALLMANFQASLHALINKRIQATEFIQELNANVFQITKGEKFITFFIAEFNTETKELIYVNAGHNPPILVCGGALQLLEKGCTILGCFEELPKVEVGRLRVCEDALILTFTDGITDVRNKAGDFYNEERLHAFAQSHHHLDARHFNALLQAELESFREGESYPDDITVLTCRLYA